MFAGDSRPDNTDPISRQRETVKVVRNPCFSALDTSLSQQTGGKIVFVPLLSPVFQRVHSGSLKMFFKCPLYYSKRKHHLTTTSPPPPPQLQQKIYESSSHWSPLFSLYTTEMCEIFPASKTGRLMVYSWVIMLSFTNIYLFKISPAGPHMTRPWA